MLAIRVKMEKKIYSSKSLLLVLIILDMQTFTISTISPKNDNMLDKINVCNTVKFVQNSTHISTQCSAILYTKTFQANENLAMCMVVYDIMNKICIYDNKTLVNIKKLKVPSNALEFDLEVEKLEPKHSDYETFLNEFCKNVTNIFSNLNSIIQSDSYMTKYIKFLQDDFLGQKDCIRTCLQHNYTVNPFCLIFLWANNLFNSLNSPNLTQDNSDTIVNTKTIVTDPKLMEQTQVATVIESKPVDIKQEKSDKDLKQTININKNGSKQTITHQDSFSNNDQKSNEPKINSVNLNLSNINKVDDAKKSVQVSQTESQRESKNYINLPSNNDKTIDMDQREIEEGNVNTQLDPSEDHETKKENIEEDALKDQMNDMNDQEPKYNHDSAREDEDESHFFTYLSIFSLFCIGLYVGYQNKKKILAMVLEGRRSRRSRGSRRRPSSANYRKLDCNLEEAVTSQCSSNTTNVIY